MIWSEALAAMWHGHQVRRVSESVRTQISSTMYEDGTEPTELAPAWTADGEPVKVFRGAWSGVLFKPTPDHMKAFDWIVTHKEGK